MPKGVSDVDESPYTDFSSENVPVPAVVCVECDGAVSLHFDVLESTPDGRYVLDEAAGLDHRAKTLDYYLDRGYATEETLYKAYLNPNQEELDYRTNFLILVLREVQRHLKQVHGKKSKHFIEFFAYIQSHEFVCIEESIAFSEEGIEQFVPRLGLHTSAVDEEKQIASQSFMNNFIFPGSLGKFESFVAGHQPKIIYTSYSHTDTEYAHAWQVLNNDYDYTTQWNLKGRYDIALAAKQLLMNYYEQLDVDKRDKRVMAAIELGLAGLCFVPVVGQVGLAARLAIGGYRFLRPALQATASVLAITEMTVHGSTQLITGEEGLSLGEKFFIEVGLLLDPENGDERALQVYAYVNLFLLLVPVGGFTAKYTLSRLDIGNKVVRYTSEIEAKADRLLAAGRIYVFHLTLKASDRFGHRVEFINTPSLQTQASFCSSIPRGPNAKANTIIKANDPDQELIANVMATKGHGKAPNQVVGAIGEAYARRYLIHDLGVKEEYILGALENSSGQGIDLIVRVPPPDKILMRDPQTTTERNGIAGSDPRFAGLSKELDLRSYAEGERLLTIEVKTTHTIKKDSEGNDTQYTPSLSKSTQAQGGEANLQRVLGRVGEPEGHYSHKNMINTTPNYVNISEQLKDAMREGRVECMHIQVFLNPDNTRNVAVGGGSGIQMNTW